MDHFFRQKGTEIQQQGTIFAVAQILERTINWFTDLIQLTEEEQQDAGIYLS